VQNLLPEKVHRAIWLRMPASFRLGRMMEAKLRSMDVAHDRFFVLEGDCAVAIRVNLDGREKHGVVPATDGHAVLGDLWSELQRYRTETGESPFVSMVLTAEAYSGPRVDQLPDAMLLYNPNVQRTRELTRDDGVLVRLVVPESRNGIHTGRGFCFYRPAGDVAIKRDEFDNLDFAPTILQRLGVTPPDRLEGSSFL
jgi:predicted AlkP superfamily phosphohydrolase/phosphomutase